MNFYINSPSCYTQIHGIVEDVYSMCSALSKSIDISLYTDILDTIAITPIIAPDYLIGQGLYNEHKIVKRNTRMADISLQLSYEDYIHANDVIKKRMIINNILQSLKSIKKILKADFDYEKFQDRVILVAEDFFDEDF